LYPWLSTAGTLVASGRLLGLPIVCCGRCGLHEPCEPTFKSAEKLKNNDRKTLTLQKLFLVFVIIIEEQGYSKIKQMKEKLKNEKKMERNNHQKKYY